MATQDLALTARFRRARPVLMLGLLAVVAGLLTVNRYQRKEILYAGQPALVWAQRLHSPSAETRTEAEEVVRRLSTDLVPAFISLLNTPDPILGKPFVLSQRWLPNRLVRKLSRLIRPGDAQMKRLCAADALGFLGPKATPAIPFLVRALHDEPRVAWPAALALARMEEPGAEVLVKQLEHPSQLPCSSLGYVCYALSTSRQLTTNVIPSLVSIMETSCPEAAERAARALGTLGRAALPELLETLENSNRVIQTRALRAFAGIGLPARDAIPQLLAFATSDNAAVRQATISALAQIRPTAPEVLVVLTNALSDPDLQTRLEALNGLGRSMRPPDAAAFALVAALEDTNATVRAQAALLLGTMPSGTNRSVPALQKKLDDPHPIVRTRAREALERLQVRP